MSAAVNEIAIRTSLAAVRKDSRLRVYETAVDGGIREARYEGGWSGGTQADVKAIGKIGGPVAAAAIGLETIRIYYISPSNQIQEHCQDNGGAWYAGALNASKFAVAPYSSVAAVFLGGVPRIRVYAQIADDTIQEYLYEGGWSKGVTNFGAALPGTSIAATTWGTGSNIRIRVYFQTADLNVVEKCWDGNGWYNGGLRFANPVVRASLAVTSWESGNGVSLRVYYGAPGNRILEKGYDGSGWYDGGFSQPSIPASTVAAIPIPVLRVYIQNGTQNTAVTEYAWGSSGWVVGQKALPPAA